MEAKVQRYGSAAARTREAGSARALLLFVRSSAFLDLHIFELARFEYFAAFLAFDVFCIFVARDDLNLRMFALAWINFLLGWLRRLNRRHSIGTCFIRLEELGNLLKLAVFWGGSERKSSPGRCLQMVTWRVSRDKNRWQ
jgi:hypothetical protein